MLNLIISALRILWRVLSKMVARLAPDEFARVAQAELRSLDAALGGVLLLDRQMNWMQRGRPGLQLARAAR
jgi:hypothetical protein